MTRQYAPPTRPNESPAPCYPEQRRSVCLTCSRRKEGRPLPPEMRQFVVVDASLYATDANCPMHRPWPLVRHFAEVDSLARVLENP